MGEVLVVKSEIDPELEAIIQSEVNEQMTLGSRSSITSKPEKRAELRLRGGAMEYLGASASVEEQWKFFNNVQDRLKRVELERLPIAGSGSTWLTKSEFLMLPRQARLHKILRFQWKVIYLSEAGAKLDLFRIPSLRWTDIVVGLLFIASIFVGASVPPEPRLYTLGSVAEENANNR